MTWDGSARAKQRGTRGAGSNGVETLGQGGGGKKMGEAAVSERARGWQQWGRRREGGQQVQEGWGAVGERRGRGLADLDRLTNSKLNRPDVTRNHMTDDFLHRNGNSAKLLIMSNSAHANKQCSSCN